MKSKLPPATSYLPRKPDVVLINQRISPELKAELDEAAKKLSVTAGKRITVNDLCEAAFRWYLAALKEDGHI
jgi:hypothetical protein